MSFYKQVTGIIVTKGDRTAEEIARVVASLPFEDVIVWDNSKREKDLKVYGRFEAIKEAKNEIIYVQDDDVIVYVAGLLPFYNPDYVVCNMPVDRRQGYAGTGISLIGWGGLFHRKWANFDRYFAQFPADELFYRECDRVFTYINSCQEVAIPHEQLDYAWGQDRMGTEKRHNSDFNFIRQRLRELR